MHNYLMHTQRLLLTGLTAMVAIHAIGQTCPAESLLVATNGSTSLSVLDYNYSNGSLIGTFATTSSSGIGGMTLNSTGSTVYVATSNGIYQYAAAGGAYGGVYDSSLGGSNLTLGPNGSLYSVLNNQIYQASPPSSQSLFAQGQSGGYYEGLAFSGSKIYTVDSNNENIQTFNATTGAYNGVLGTLANGEYATAFTMGSDGNLYIAFYDTSTNGSYISEYSGSTGALIKQFPSEVGVGKDASYSSLAFGPDGNLYGALSFYQGSSEGEIDRYNGTTGAYLGAFVTGVTEETSIVFASVVIPPVVPEPSTIVLLGMAVPVVAGWMRLRTGKPRLT